MSGLRALHVLHSGLDVMLDDPAPLRGRRIGLLANPASVTSSLVPSARALKDAGLDVSVLFGPEHGLAGAAQDMEAVAPSEASEVRVVSLYGESFDELSPKEEHLAGIDVVVSDLPDVGSRYYTFVWTTALMMRACAARKIPVWVLDRPNPLGGLAVEGNLPDDDRLLSFVGLHPLPVRHGMTAGEIARYVNSEFGLGCDLHHVPMRIGRRAPSRGELADMASWVIPSPNMPTPTTALVYPGGCLFEGTNLSEGRGTTRPFEFVGAPWLDASRTVDAANALGLPGVTFRPHVFKPTFQKHAGEPCGGVQIHVSDRESFRPYETGLRLLKCLRDMAPPRFRWRTETYEYRGDVPAIDLLTGTRRYRELVDRGASLDEWIDSFAGDLSRFAPVRERNLLYPSHDPRPRVLLLVGAHESGKTTLMVRLIEALTRDGVLVGSVKHTDHEYDTDLPGKDSFRHKAAGAEPALLVAGRRSAVHRTEVESPRLETLLSRELGSCDVVLVEGYRRANYPKIEIARAATGRAPVAVEDSLVVAVVTDRETPHAASIPRFGFDDFERLLELVKQDLGVSR